MIAIELTVEIQPDRTTIQQEVQPAPDKSGLEDLQSELVEARCRGGTRGEGDAAVVAVGGASAKERDMELGILNGSLCMYQIVGNGSLLMCQIGSFDRGRI